MEDINLIRKSIACRSISETELEKKADFTVRKEGGFLAHYLAYRMTDNEIFSPAMQEEKSFRARTYIVEDTVTGEILAYFTLKAGMVGIKQNRLPYNHSFDAVPGIEIANLAVNETYKKAHNNLKGIGYMVFRNYVIPKVKEAQAIVGVKMLYCYALPHGELLSHYKKYGFTQLASFQQRYIEKRFRPSYDKGCVFMYQILN